MRAPSSTIPETGVPSRSNQRVNNLRALTIRRLKSLSSRRLFRPQAAPAPTASHPHSPRGSLRRALDLVLRRDVIPGAYLGCQWHIIDARPEPCRATEHPEE